MSKLILYLLETSAVLFVLYSLYMILLRKETFFNFNRYFLLTICTLSFLYPLLNIDLFPSKVRMINQPIEQLSKVRISYYEALETWSYEETKEGIDNDGIVANTNSAKENTKIGDLVLRITLSIYGVGLVAMLFLFFWKVNWIMRLKSSNPKENIQGVKVVKVPRKIAPFSFMKYVFIQEDMIDSGELNQILTHEKTHIKQRHSIDLLFVQLLAAILWFNPVVWLLIKSLKTTHEYIADKKMINQGYSLVEYQTLLLRQLISNNSYGLVHNFNLSFIKKRITMMKIKESGWVGKSKVVFTLFTVVVISLLIMQCNSKFEDQVSFESPTTSIEEVEVPGSGYLPTSLTMMMPYDPNLSNSLTLTLVSGKVSINGNDYPVDELAMILLKETNSSDATILVQLNQSTPMSIVEHVLGQLKETDRRKIIFFGQNTAGVEVEVPMELYKYGSTNPGTAQVNEIVEIMLLHINVSKDQDQSLDNLVYDLVLAQTKNYTREYILLVEYEGGDSYGTYLKNLALTSKGLNRIYSERANFMFHKDYKDLSGEEYLEVRKGAPNAIMLRNKIALSPVNDVPVIQEQDAPIPSRKPLDEKDIERLSSGFGMRMHPNFKVKKMHIGVDFLSDTGKPVYATADGQIVQIQTSALGEGYGKLAAIKHSNGIVTRYAHMSGFNDIEVGQKVKQGDVIGFVGNTGKSIEPHLHYEVLIHNKPVDPSEYFK